MLVYISVIVHFITLYISWISSTLLTLITIVYTSVCSYSVVHSFIGCNTLCTQTPLTVLYIHIDCRYMFGRVEFVHCAVYLWHTTHDNYDYYVVHIVSPRLLITFAVWPCQLLGICYLSLIIPNECLPDAHLASHLYILRSRRYCVIIRIL
jgi:hypothetical protein